MLMLSILFSLFPKTLLGFQQSTNESNLQVESQAAIIFFIWLLQWFILGTKLMSLKDVQAAGKKVCVRVRKSGLVIRRDC